MEKGRFLGLEYRWGALASTSLGALLATVNASTLIIALPELARVLHADLFTLIWVLLSYMLAQTVLVLTIGRFADMVGRKKLYVGGFAAFTVVSLVAGFATNAGQLVIVRTLMGIAGALMMANSSVIVTDAFSEKGLGQALGINQMVAAVGSIIGPVVGGILISISWEWVFWFNVPIGVVGTIWAALNLRELVDIEKGQRLDLWGNLTFLVGLTALLIALTMGGIEGWGTGLVVASFVVAAIALPAFFFVELRSRDPLIDLHMFKGRVFAFGNASAMLNALARMAVTFLFVFYFVGGKGFSHLQTGFLLIPLAVAMFVFAPISGRLADRLSARALSSVGLTITTVGLLGMLTIGIETPYWQIALWMAIVGAGSGIFNSPNTRAIMHSVPPEKRGIASGTRTLVTNLGGVFSIAFALVMVTSAMPKSLLFKVFSGESRGLSVAAAQPFIAGLHGAFMVMAAASLIGIFFSALRGEEYNVSQEESGPPEAREGSPAREKARR